MKPLKNTGNLKGLDKVHFLGVGGSGMSTLAEYLYHQGFLVTGYDGTTSTTTQHLEQVGILLEDVNTTRYLLDSDLVVYSSAIPKEHPKMKLAEEQGIPRMRRADFLGQVMQKKWALTVSGTHGKTTTTFMLGSIWSEAEQNPIVLGGGYTKNKEEWKVQSGLQKEKTQGEVLIAEADEYDRSFLKMYPTWALINNLEEEHMDCYKDLEELCDVFLEFMHRVPPFGTVVVNHDDSNLKKLLPRLERKYVTFGFTQEATYQARPVNKENGNSVFDVYYKQKAIAQVKLPLLGKHNIYNALGAFAISHVAGLPVEPIVQGLEKFKGVQRRLDLVGEVGGVRIYDDYAHHPSEVAATIEALSSLKTNSSTEQYSTRLVVVFQPHLYSRTQAFYKEFAEALKEADCIFVTPVYKSREKEIPGVSEQLIVEHLESVKKESTVVHTLSLEEEGEKYLQTQLQTGDVVVTMGAGDIWKMGKAILKRMEQGEEVKTS